MFVVDTTNAPEPPRHHRACRRRQMGGAMLTGWLAGGLDASRVMVVEPHPSDEIKALAAKASASIRRTPARPIRWWSR